MQLLPERKGTMKLAYKKSFSRLGTKISLPCGVISQLPLRLPSSRETKPYHFTSACTCVNQHMTGFQSLEFHRVQCPKFDSAEILATNLLPHVKCIIGCSRAVLTFQRRAGSTYGWNSVLEPFIIMLRLILYLVCIKVFKVTKQSSSTVGSIGGRAICIFAYELQPLVAVVRFFSLLRHYDIMDFNASDFAQTTEEITTAA